MTRIHCRICTLLGVTMVVALADPQITRSTPSPETAPLPAEGINFPEAARRISPGMTVADVECLLGPARIEAGCSTIAHYPPTVCLVLTRGGPRESDMRWVSGKVAITVRVDNKKNVYCKYGVLFRKSSHNLRGELGADTYNEGVGSPSATGKNKGALPCLPFSMTSPRKFST